VHHTDPDIRIHLCSFPSHNFDFEVLLSNFQHTAN
jgi:hypothetical protein